MAHEILPNLFHIVVPLPNSPLKAINSFVIRGDSRNLVIDTGMNRPECVAALDAGFEEIGIDLDRTDFLATHLHADHCGLVPHYLREGCTAHMGAVDAAAMKREFSWSANSDMGVYLKRSGFPAAELESSFRNHPAAKFGSGRNVDYEPLHEGDTIRVGGYELEVIDTPGHTFGHISLYDRKRALFIAGDHVLGDITPNIQAWSDEHDPLDQFLASLGKVRELDVELCLPGHRSLIDDFAGRVSELEQHHHDRATETVDVLGGGPKNAYETAAGMTWDVRADSWEDFPIMQRWFATGETIAHLRYLEDLDRINRLSASGTDSLIVYETLTS